MPSISSRPSARLSRTPAAERTTSGSNSAGIGAYGCQTWARSRASKLLCVAGTGHPGSIDQDVSTEPRSWLRCYRCWSQDLEVQVHYEGIHKIDPETGERADVVDEIQEAVVQCLECMHDQPHLGFVDGRVEPVEDRWERMVTGTPWVASCTVTVPPRRRELLGTRGRRLALIRRVRRLGSRVLHSRALSQHDDDARITVHLLVELYARSLDEAGEVLEGAAQGALTITSLAEESRPPAATGGGPPLALVRRPRRMRRGTDRCMHRSAAGACPPVASSADAARGRRAAPSARPAGDRRRSRMLAQ